MNLKNTVEVSIAGDLYKLNYDMASLMQFEEKSGVGLSYVQAIFFKVSQDATDDEGNTDSTLLMVDFSKHFKTRWAVAAVYAGLYGTESQKSWAEVEELCFNHGVGLLSALFFSLFPYFMGVVSKKNEAAVEELKE